MKKVIFIGGTSYSGSTILDMIIANDQRGFSCGETYALFKPFRQHHINPECGCGQEHCDLWQIALKNGEKNIYRTVFDKFPQVEFIVDSSKNPYWIDSQTRILKMQNLKVKNILIWKTPFEFGKSLKKRNRLKNLERAWINYHRLYFTLVKDWRSIRYSNLVNDEICLKEICNYLEIPYFHGKIKYWEKKHHTLFGNTSSKIHLYSENTRMFEKSREELLKQNGETSRQIDDNLRTIHYESVNKELERTIDDIVSSNRRIKLILKLLNSKALLRGDQKEKTCELDFSSLKYNKYLALARLILQRYLRII